MGTRRQPHRGGEDATGWEFVWDLGTMYVEDSDDLRGVILRELRRTAGNMSATARFFECDRMLLWHYIRVLRLRADLERIRAEARSIYGCRTSKRGFAVVGYRFRRAP